MPRNNLWPQALHAWYVQNHRHLPWRATPGAQQDPYKVWLSEIMLQQTTVPTVIPYFTKFLQKWPTIQAFSQASLDEVLHAWQGLGYYARARNMHKCAQQVVEKYYGKFPSDLLELQALSGVGPYTAAALRSIAFQQPASVVDGNIERVIARLYGISTPFPAAHALVKEHVHNAMEAIQFPGDLAQAMMDLGSSICTPRSPLCPLCPIQKGCMAYKENKTQEWPAYPPKALRPLRQAYTFWVQTKDREVLLERRPEKGLLGSLMGFPSTPWQEGPLDPASVLSLKTALNLEGKGEYLSFPIKHTFTHFQLYLWPVLWTQEQRRTSGLWTPIDQLDRHALPTVMRKVEHEILKRGKHDTL